MEIIEINKKKKKMWADGIKSMFEGTDARREENGVWKTTNVKSVKRMTSPHPYKKEKKKKRKEKEIKTQLKWKRGSFLRLFHL